LADDPPIGIQVQIHSISVRAAEFTASQFLEIFQTEEMEIKPSDGGQPLRLALKVAWVTRNEQTGSCRAGCEWSRQLAAREIDGLAINQANRPVFDWVKFE
jgi:hypothetical protein